ncbi:hypothetical protein F5Y06DRAFT_294838 [Hypoxylon sp. FL0890]|nr:hypothetical protein F5Y06DRAFT_294838 [Hypoxylon sp. FL0890]
MPLLSKGQDLPYRGKMYRYLALIVLPLVFHAQALPDPIICEDTLDGSPPFNSNDVPCLLRCGVPIAVPTGSLLPGSVNETDIPYCQLNCVHTNASPSQSAVAPDCYQGCRVMNQGTPENVGWCMYWCVDGFTDLVESTACVPSLEYGSLVTSTEGGVTVTFRPFTQPPEWQSWYQTQTVLPKSGVSGQGVTAPSPSPTITAPPSSTTASAASSSGGSPSTQETQSPTSLGDAESVVSAGTQELSNSSPTTTGAASRLCQGNLLGYLGAVGCLIVVALI